MLCRSNQQGSSGSQPQVTNACLALSDGTLLAGLHARRNMVVLFSTRLKFCRLIIDKRFFGSPDGPRAVRFSDSREQSAPAARHASFSDHNCAPAEQEPTAPTHRRCACPLPVIAYTSHRLPSRGPDLQGVVARRLAQGRPGRPESCQRGASSDTKARRRPAAASTRRSRTCRSASISRRPAASSAGAPLRGGEGRRPAGMKGIYVSLDEGEQAAFRS